MKTIKQSGIYRSQIMQLDKLARHNRQGSFRTKDRYYEAFKRFCAFLADHYQLQKIENISGKHLVAYVLYMQEHGKSASTIKTDLSAIRFFHDKMSDPKYRLPTNAELGIELEQRLFAEADRAWTVPEFNRALAAAQAERRYDYILALYLARYAGLRIHECFRIDTATAEKALRENMITVKGKGGKIRSVPIPEHIRPILETLLDRTERGHKLLVPDDKPTDQAIKELQGFLRRERAMIQDPGDDRPLTFHGLRHSYASDTYMNLLGDGMSALDAHFEVSRLLGHERADVTNIYLASVRGKLDEGKEDGQ